MSINQLVNNVTSVLINPAIFLLFAVALLYFVWGLVQFLYTMNIGGKVDKKGKDHMIWGIVGMFIMVAAYGIIHLIDNTIGSNLVH